MTNEFLFSQSEANLLWFHDPLVVHFALHFVGTYRRNEGFSTNISAYEPSCSHRIQAAIYGNEGKFKISAKQSQVSAHLCVEVDLST